MPNNPTVSVDVKQHFSQSQELCESRCGRPGLPVPIVSVDGNNMELEQSSQNSGAVRKSSGRPGLFLVPNSPYGLYGRKATLNLNQ